MVKPTSKSYTYITAGLVNGVHLMKVGKTNHLQRRSRQLALPIEFSTASLSKVGALRLEDELRQFVLAQNGVRFRNTPDWFAFDERIYDLLREYLISRSAPECAQILSPDEEIALYRSVIFNC